MMLVQEDAEWIRGEQDRRISQVRHLVNSKMDDIGSSASSDSDNVTCIAAVTSKCQDFRS